MPPLIKKYRFEIAIFVAYLLLAVVWSWPLVLRFNSSIYGLRGDHFGQLWSDWWRKKAILSGGSFFYTPLLDAPFGFSYQALGFEPLHLALRFFLTLLTNEVISFNLWFLLSFPFSGLAVYFLVRELGVRRLAAAFSGLVFAFSMYRFSHAWEHSSLIFTFWMPLYVWALVRFDRRPKAKSNALAAALLAAVVLDNFYYGYFALIFTFFFFLLRLRRFLSRSGFKQLLLFGLFFFVFSAPPLFPTFRAYLSRDSLHQIDRWDYQWPADDLRWLSARPWHYLLPSPRHPFLGRFSQRIIDWIATKPPYFLTQGYDGNEHNLYLTMTALVLAAVAVLVAFRRRKESNSVSVCQWRQWVGVFLALGITMAIFSAPPLATLSGLRIYFPSHFLYKFFPMFRAYARFGVLVLLCVSVLAGFGLSFLLERLPVKRQYLLTIILSLTALFEVLLPSFNVDLSPPPVYHWLAEQPGDFIILEYPLPTDHSDLLYQRVHGKKLFDPRREKTSRVLKSVAQKEGLNFRLLSESVVEFPDVLRRMGVKYVILHKDRHDPLKRLDNVVNWEGYRVAVEFPDTTVYEVVGEYGQ
jgi:hypothetical protein